MKLYNVVIIELTEKQYACVDRSDLDYNSHALWDIRHSTLRFPAWDYEHGLSRSQKAVDRKVCRAKLAGAHFVIFVRIGRKNNVY